MAADVWLVGPACAWSNGSFGDARVSSLFLIGDWVRYFTHAGEWIHGFQGKSWWRPWSSRCSPLGPGLQLYSELNGNWQDKRERYFGEVGGIRLSYEVTCGCDATPSLQ